MPMPIPSGPLMPPYVCAFKIIGVIVVYMSMHTALSFWMSPSMCNYYCIGAIAVVRAYWHDDIVISFDLSLSLWAVMDMLPSYCSWLIEARYQIDSCYRSFRFTWRIFTMLSAGYMTTSIYDIFSISSDIRNSFNLVVDIPLRKLSFAHLPTSGISRRGRGGFWR